MKPKIIVAGTGRDGTVSMNHFFNEIFTQEKTGMTSCHEFAARDCYNLVDKFWHSQQAGKEDVTALEELRTIFAKCPYDAIVGNGYSLAQRYIPDLFDKNCYFIHLKRRDRQACINSWIKCCTLFPEANGHYTDDHSTDIQVWRMTAFHFGEMTKDEWAKLSLNEKCAWYYDKTHETIEELATQFPKRMSFFTEDLSNPDRLAELAHFLDIKLTSKPQPSKKNAFTYADVTHVSEHFVPKAQWQFGNFDFPKAVEDNTYAIDYFCERYISWYSYLRSKQDKGEMEKYIPDDKVLLKEIREAREILHKWQRQFELLEQTVTNPIASKLNPTKIKQKLLSLVR